LSHPWVVRNTASRRGRNLVITPRNSDTKYLSVGRVILDGELNRVSLKPDGQETGFICLHGSGSIELDGKRYKMEPYDGLYLPRDKEVEITTESSLDLVEMRAPVDKVYPVAYVPFSKVEEDPELSPWLGGQCSRRRVLMILGPNIKSGRLLAGITVGNSGHWTSWPPHEHGEIQEEVYLYFDIPAPGFGIQLVYTNPEDMECLVAVRSDDACIMPRGYHPNVAAPGYRMSFVWVLCAYREELDRHWGKVTFQPGIKETVDEE